MIAGGETTWHGFAEAIVALLDRSPEDWALGVSCAKVEVEIPLMKRPIVHCDPEIQGGFRCSMAPVFR